MLPKDLKKDAEQFVKEAAHIIKISGQGKNSEETYERAKSTLDMVEIAVRMLISDLEKEKVKILKK